MSLCAFPFATAWPVNAELAAPSVSKPSFGAIKSRYPAFRQSMSVWATKALAPSSTSARPADRPSTTSRRDRRSTLLFPSGHSLIPAFPLRRSLSMKNACTPGLACPKASSTWRRQRRLELAQAAIAAGWRSNQQRCVVRRPSRSGERLTRDLVLSAVPTGAFAAVCNARSLERETLSLKTGGGRPGRNGLNPQTTRNRHPLSGSHRPKAVGRTAHGHVNEAPQRRLRDCRLTLQAEVPRRGAESIGQVESERLGPVGRRGGGIS